MALSPVSNGLRALRGHLYSQFSRPRGPLGALAGRIMSSRGSNVERNRWLIDLLSLEPENRVLELGPGPGVALELAAAKASHGQLVGIDHSSTMLRQARRRNRAAVSDGRVRLIKGSAEALPADVGPFDRIYCMNVWQFWADQEVVIATLVGLLAPGGLLGIGYQPRAQGADAADTEAASHCLEDQLGAGGLVDVAAHRLDLRPTPVAAVVGKRR